MTEPLTKRKATQGKKLSVKKEFKGQICFIQDKSLRRHILNMHLEMLATEEIRRMSRNKNKQKEPQEVE